jgi:hypothetical protein
MDNNLALTPRAFPDAPSSGTIMEPAADLGCRSYIQQRRLADVLNGIADARRRIDQFTIVANSQLATWTPPTPSVMRPAQRMERRPTGDW